MFDLIALGIIIAIEPLPVIGFILVLSTKGGVRNGAAFIAGWVLTLVAIIVATLTLTGGAPPRSNTAPAAAVAAVDIVIGGLLLVLAARVRRRPQDAPRSAPSWEKRLDRLTPWGAALLGLLLQPWPLVAAAAGSVTQADASSTVAIIVLVLFCLLASLSLLAMEVYSVRSPEASRGRLEALRAWLDRNRDKGIVVLSLVVGLWLIGKGVFTLLSQG